MEFSEPKLIFGLDVSGLLSYSDYNRNDQCGDSNRAKHKIDHSIKL